MSSVVVARHPSNARIPYRPDIEGLRGIAVTLVVAFHVALAGFAGGFVGVDVFYVISGYLISGSLWREVTQTGTIAFPDFYARRVRRLIPAVAVMLMVTTLLASLLLPPLELQRVASSIRAAALYASNEHFRMLSSDYFSGAVRSDPVLHTWSLSVEEQFYFVWPCLIWLVWRIGVAAGSPTRWLRWAFALVVASSFAGTCILADASRSAVFFSAPFRAWEFAVGGVAATWESPQWIGSERRRRLAMLISVLGAFAVAYAANQFSSTTQFPGVPSLIPVIGTAFLLVGGARSGTPQHGIARALTSPPLAWLGKRSYSWYLWHWPLLVFAAAWSPRNSLALRLGVAGVALLIASLSYEYVETPVRNVKLSIGRRRQVLVAGICAGVFVACASLALRGWSDHVLKDPVRAHYAAAASDLPRLYADGCVNGEVDYRVHICEYGLSNGTPIALYGDSHAVQWYPALEKIAIARGWKILVAAKTQCATALIPAYVSYPPRRFEACERWRRAAADAIAARHPRFVLIANASAYVKDPFRTGTAPIVSADVWRDGLISLLAGFDTRDVRPILIRDTPRLRTDVPACLSRGGILGRVAQRCGEPRFIAINHDLVAAEDSALHAVPHTGLVDMTDVVCPGEVCMPIVRGLVGYSDVDHLSATLVAAIAVQLDAAIARGIGEDVQTAISPRN